MTTWTELTEKQQREIISLMDEGACVDDVAAKYGLLSGSLARKLRLLSQKNKPDKILGYKHKRLVIDKPTRVFVYSDCHFGYEDPDALELALIVAQEFRPEVIINLGDTLDFYNLSRFKKDPNSPTLQNERDKWFEWAERLNGACPNARKIIIRGNHEERSEVLLVDTNRLFDLEELSLDALLYTKELGYDQIVDVVYVNPSGDDVYPDAMLYIMHGERALSNAGSSARAASDMYAGASIMVGHAHRSAIYTRRTGRGMTVSYEVGTLASLQPEYEMFPNWSQSVLTGILSSDYHDFQLHIINKKSVSCGGKVFKL